MKTTEIEMKGKVDTRKGHKGPLTLPQDILSRQTPRNSRQTDNIHFRALEPGLLCVSKNSHWLFADCLIRMVCWPQPRNILAVNKLINLTNAIAHRVRTPVSPERNWSSDAIPSSWSKWRSMKRWPPKWWRSSGSTCRGSVTHNPSSARSPSRLDRPRRSSSCPSRRRGTRVYGQSRFYCLAESWDYREKK